MKFNSVIAIALVCLIASTCYFEYAEAIKKKLATAFLIGAALASKSKFKLLPVPLPIPVPIKHEKYVPVPEPYYAPPSYHYGGGYEHSGAYGPSYGNSYGGAY